MAYQRCVRCVMDNKSDRTIVFDADGYCNYCNDVIKRLPYEYFPGIEGEEKLKEIILKIKDECKNDKYDCLIGISGGIDSSYILYKAYQYGLRILAVHIDDGLDNPIAVENIRRLAKATGADIVNVSPNRDEYADVIYSLLKASVPNLAIVQDNLIMKALFDYANSNHIKYVLNGANFAHESILERGESVNSCDKKYILGIQRKFGNVKLKQLQFMSLYTRYIGSHKKSSVKQIRLLNYLNYNVMGAIKELENFCGFEYYGGKHYESILTRFMQCYYLPEKFGIDKRKSHYSSLIMSNQMSREQALQELKKPLYTDVKLLQNDKEFLAKYLKIDLCELERCIALKPRKERMYKHSILNELAPIARKFRHILE